MSKTPKLADQDYLLKDQYKDTSNLDARQYLHSQYSTNKYGWQRWVFDQIAIPPKSHILELGCGSGRLWLQNIDRVPKSWDLVLSDISSGMLKSTKENLKHLKKKIKYLVIDAQSIPFKDKVFDVVISNHMLYHVPDIKTAISEIHRVLRLGGTLYASTTGEDHMRELKRLLQKFEPSLTLWGKDSVGLFALENGAGQLSPLFSKIELRKYNDSLEVTEAEPLIQYILSTKVAKDGLIKNLDKFRKFVEQEIKTAGEFHITKEVGLFIATN